VKVLLRQAWLAVEAEASRRGVRIHLASAPGVPRIAGSAGGLTQSVSLLLRRCIAAAATPAGGKGTVQVTVDTAEAQRVKLTIAIVGNTHASSSDRPRPLPDGGDATRPAEIAIVASIIKAHGGTLSVVIASGHLHRARLTLPAAIPSTPSTDSCRAR
jgi:signal transduction histidine kinase